MNGEYSWWLLVVGLAIGVTGAWLVRGTLAREDGDLAARERVEEAAWISRTIEDAGGVAPADLVEQVLELHRSYLSGPPYLMPDSIEEDVAPAVVGAAVPAPGGGESQASVEVDAGPRVDPVEWTDGSPGSGAPARPPAVPGSAPDGSPAGDAPAAGRPVAGSST
jgi:hypothetical protein